MAVLRRSPKVPMSIPYNAAVVGSARRVNLGKRHDVEQLQNSPDAQWQAQAWDHYRSIGMVHYAYRYFSTIASRVRLFAGYQKDDSMPPVPIGNVGDISRDIVSAANYELSRLSKSRGGIPGIIKALTLNLLVSGEVYLVNPYPGRDAWSVHSTSEIQFSPAGKVTITSSRGARRNTNVYGRELDENAFVARIWTPHPQFSDDADSAMSAVSDDCEELILMGQVIKAAARSRINAGLLYVANELRFEPTNGELDEEQDPENPDPNTDLFEEELELSLTDTIGDPNSPASLVPIVVRGPAELSESGIRHIDISRSIDEEMPQRYEATMERILNGLDIPKDIVTGLAGVKYANAKEVNESMFKAHVEPMILNIVSGLTTVFLRPMLVARGCDEDVVNNVHVWYDPSEITVKADRSEDADQGYARMLVSGSAWRRAHGFSDSDAPEEKELVQRIALAGNVAPSTTLEFMRAVAPDFVAQAEKLAQEQMSASFEPAPSEQPNSGAEEVAPSNPGQETPPQQPNQPSDGGSGVPPQESNDSPYGEQPPTESADSDTMKMLVDLLRRSSGEALGQDQPAEFAADTQSAELRLRNRKMELALEVEREMRAELFILANTIMQRALERAGARVTSKVRGDKEIKNLISDVPLEAVFSAIPMESRTTFGLDPRQLVRDTILAGKEKFTKIVKAGQKRGWSIFGSKVSDEMSKTQTERVADAWDWIAAAMIELAAKRLAQPDPDKGGMFVSKEFVRKAMSLLGGGDPEDKLASGRAIITGDVLDAAGWDYDTSGGYRWVYGMSDNHFEPHFRLDGRTFDTWESPALRNRETWPPVPFYFPGDHNGCQCDWLPRLLDPDRETAPDIPDVEVPASESVAASGAHTVARDR